MPTLSSAGTAFNTGTSPKTAAISWGAGDLVLAFAMKENNDSGNGLSTPTFTGGTFVSVDLDVFTGTGTHCGGSSWQCTPSGSGSGNVSFTATGSGDYGGIVVVAAAGTHNGIGVHGNPNDTNLTQSMTVSQGSAVAMLMGDWAGADPTGYGYTPAGAVEPVAAGFVSGHYGWYDAYWNTQAAGTRGYGETGATGIGQFTKVYIEILAGGTSVTVIPPARTDVLIA